MADVYSAMYIDTRQVAKIASSAVVDVRPSPCSRSCRNSEYLLKNSAHGVNGVMITPYAVTVGFDYRIVAGERRIFSSAAMNTGTFA